VLRKTRSYESTKGGRRSIGLETARCPEIVFQGKEITAGKIAENWYRVQFSGKLSLHGVTNPHQVDTQLRIVGDQVRLSGDCTLRPSAYRIKPVSALGGLITLRDELKFVYEIVGRKQDD
jgi:polyisoprenoid-binding protein YceI